MLAFKREAVALLVLMLCFLVLEQQTQESRLQELLQTTLSVRGHGRETNSGLKLLLLNGKFVSRMVEGEL